MQGCQYFIREIRIRVYILDIIQVFEGINQAHDFSPARIVHLRPGPRNTIAATPKITHTPPVRVRLYGRSPKNRPAANIDETGISKIKGIT